MAEPIQAPSLVSTGKTGIWMTWFKIFKLIETKLQRRLKKLRSKYRWRRMICWWRQPNLWDCLSLRVPIDPNLYWMKISISSTPGKRWRIKPEVDQLNIQRTLSTGTEFVNCIWKMINTISWRSFKIQIVVSKILFGNIMVYHMSIRIKSWWIRSTPHQIRKSLKISINQSLMKLCLLRFIQYWKHNRISERKRKQMPIKNRKK